MSAACERRWLLDRARRQGVLVLSGGLERGVKKWEAHKAWLVKQGYLEADEYGLHRMTEAGETWLKEDGNG